MKGRITTIQRMSIHDGPGIRSTIFMKGCNLRCQWCHNPETFSTKDELEWIHDKCINCGECVAICKNNALSFNAGLVQFNKKQCTACFDCIESCYPEALHKIGRSITPLQLMEEIEQDFMFFKQSGGGITISGGEPMLQPSFVNETLKLFHQAKISTALETNLSFSWDQYKMILPYTDLIMCDLKLMNDRQHKYWTGSSNRKILENLLNLDRTGKPYYVRTPVIPGVNHTPKQIREIAAFISQLKNITKYELLPFHPLANSKYHNLGIKNPFEGVNAISKEELKPYYSILNTYNII